MNDFIKLGLLSQNNRNTIEDIYDRKNNAFDLLRFIFATLVIYSHCYPLLLGGNNTGDFLAKLTNGQIDCGSFAVTSFFIISGFLITQSVQNSETYRIYLIKRILRIFPAFFVSLFLIAFILGPIVTSKSFENYFQDDGINGPFSFIIKNITLNVFGYSWTVHDVFANNPFPLSANGSMWTLKHEFACYLLLLILSYFYILRHRILTLVITIASGLLLILEYQNHHIFSFYKDTGWIFKNGCLFNNSEYDSFIYFSFYFMTGVCLFIFRDKVHIYSRWIILSLVILFLSIRLNYMKYALMIVLPYLVIAVGTQYKLSFFRKHGDFSYGMYIYAFPIQQMIIFACGNYLNIITLFLFSFILTLFISYFSWKLVENPFIKLKKFIC